MMKEQNYKTHRRLIPLYHGATFLMVLLVIGGSINNFFLSLGNAERIYSASLILLISLILLSMFFFARIFALRAQDRAIRAEENLRHLALTGRLLPTELSIGQIIALRFAPNEELPTLAEQAAREHMKPDAIKRAILKWRADHHRV